MLLKEKDENLATVFISFFAKIIEALQSKHLDSKVIRAISKQEEYVVEKALSLNIPDDRLPFLPVWPLNRMKLLNQLDLIKDPRGTPGDFNHSDRIQDYFILNEQYFMFGIEDGREMAMNSFEEAKLEFEDQGRYPLIATEVISVAMFNGSLERRDLLAMGSTYGSRSEYLLLTTQSTEATKQFITVTPENIKDNVGKPSCMHRECFL